MDALGCLTRQDSRQCAGNTISPRGSVGSDRDESSFLFSRVSLVGALPSVDFSLIVNLYLCDTVSGSFLLLMLMGVKLLEKCSSKRMLYFLIVFVVSLTEQVVEFTTTTRTEGQFAELLQFSCGCLL